MLHLFGALLVHYACITLHLRPLEICCTCAVHC